MKNLLRSLKVFFPIMSLKLELTEGDGGSESGNLPEGQSSGESQSESQQSGQVESGKVGSQEAPGKPKSDQYDPKWWMNDERFTKRKIWKGPDDIIKSYFHLDKEYPVLKEKATGLESQVNELTSIFKEFGVEPTAEQIKNALAELKTVKDPNSLVNKRNNFLGYWLDDESRIQRYGEKIDKFFSELTEQELLDNHPGLTRDQAIKQHELETAQKELQRKLDAIENDKATQIASQRLVKGLDEAKKYSERMGLEFTDDIKNSLIDSCLKSQIPTAYVFQEFLRLNADALEKAYSDKIKQSQLNELNKGNRSTVPGAGAGTPASSKDNKPDFKRDALKAISSAKQ